MDISRTLERAIRKELYQDSPHLIADHSVELGGGWWLGTNLSKNDIKDRIAVACRVAGVSDPEFIEE